MLVLVFRSNFSSLSSAQLTSWPNLDTNGNSLLLPVVVFPPGVVDAPVVEFHPDADRLELVNNVLAVGRQLLHLAVFVRDWNDDNLVRRHLGRHDEAGVVTVDHDHDSNGSGGDSPAGLPRDVRRAVLGLEANVKHLAKVLAQIVARCALNGPATRGNVRLARGGLVP